MKLKVMILNLLLLLLSLSIANNAYSEETIAKSETTIVNSERKLEGVKGPVQAVVNTGTTIVNSEEKPKGIDGFEFLTDLKFWFFITGCGIISILVKVVDQSIKLNGIDSTKRIRNLKWSLLEWFLWFVSASIVGCLGYLVGLFQLSAQSAVVIGLGWPTLFAKLKSQYGNQTEVEKLLKNR
ncbi:MAG: hypothetical protein IPP22_00550 [Nitrosomonas sp.]|nr:hypothetical protein [Nitrosomonas sp.]